MTCNGLIVCRIGTSSSGCSSVGGRASWPAQSGSGRGGVPQVSNLTRIAAGVRNAAGLAFHPTTGDLYFADNGIDGLIDPEEGVRWLLRELG